MARRPLGMLCFLPTAVSLELQIDSESVEGRQVAKLDFHWIVPNLAQGSYPDPPKSAFEHFDVVVFAAEELQPRFKAPQGCYLFKVPLDDDPYRPLPVEVQKILHEAAQRISAFLLQGHKVLITCAAGRNRSGVITALVLMYCFKMSPPDAIRLIRRKRTGHDALANPMFEQFLLNAR